MKWINKNIVDLRREATRRSERVSQAIFATRVKELHQRDGWWLIETPDGYQGFVENEHLSDSSSPTGSQWKVKEAIAAVQDITTNEVLTRFAFDTRLFAKTEEGKLVFVLPNGEPGYIPQEAAISAESTQDLAELERLARALVGTPYLWGGTSPFGFDCSGFVQRLYHFCFNIWLPRDTADQRQIGESVALEALKQGDLCFFPGHVALYVGDGVIIHSNRRRNGVSIDQLLKPKDPYGKELLKAFQGARRVNSEVLQT